MQTHGDPMKVQPGFPLPQEEPTCDEELGPCLRVLGRRWWRRLQRHWRPRCAQPGWRRPRQQTPPVPSGSWRPSGGTGSGSGIDERLRARAPRRAELCPCACQSHSKGCSGPKVWSKLTFFSMMMPSTATPVKDKDTRIIITATAVFFCSAIRLNIQPLQHKRQFHTTGSLVPTRLLSFWSTRLARAPWLCTTHT